MAWSAVLRLHNCSDADFHALVSPLSLMTRLTYTATFGSYFKPSDLNASVDGWERPLTANPEVGMRALLFVEPQRQRGVVAFRGTDLDQSGKSGQADACADHFLSGGKTGDAPAFCGKFSAYTLDYASRAAEFVAAVATAFPQTKLLFTGHSLGAALAFVSASASRRSGVPVFFAVTFSSPSWTDPLRRRGEPLPSRNEVHDRFYALADWYDPVEAQGILSDGLLGQVCRWDTLRPSCSCRLCFAPPWPLRESLACKACFAQRHVYKHYLDLVPGPRAVCVNASAASLPEAAAGDIAGLAIEMGAASAACDPDPPAALEAELWRL